MSVEVRNRLSAMLALVDDQPIALGQPLLFCDDFCRVQDVLMVTFLWKFG